MNKEDIRNLITSIILRQNNKYTNASIMNTVMWVLNNSDIKLNKDINEMCISLLTDEALDIFYRRGEIKCWNGEYRTADINGYF